MYDLKYEESKSGEQQVGDESGTRKGEKMGKVIALGSAI